MDNENILEYIGDQNTNTLNETDEIYRKNKNNCNNDRFSTGSNFLDKVDLLDINALILDDEENWLQKSLDVDTDSERWMREEFEASDKEPYAFRKSLLNILNSLQDERRAQNIIPKISTNDIQMRSEIKSAQDFQPNLECDLNVESQSFLNFVHGESKPDVLIERINDEKPEIKHRPRREKTFTIESDKKSFSQDIHSPSTSADLTNFNYRPPDLLDDSNKLNRQREDIPKLLTTQNGYDSFSKDSKILSCNLKSTKNNFINQPINNLKKIDLSLDTEDSNIEPINISNDLTSLSVLDKSNKSRINDDSLSSTESLYYEASPNPLILMKTKPYGSFENCLQSNGERIGIATLIQFGDVQSAARKQEEFLKESFSDLSSRKSNRLTRSTDLQLEDAPSSFNHYSAHSEMSDACQRSLPNLNDQLSLAKQPSPTSFQELHDLPITNFKKPFNPKNPHKFCAPKILDPGNLALVSGSQLRAPLIVNSHMNGDSYQFSSKLSAPPGRLNATFAKFNGLKYHSTPTSIKTSIPDKSLNTQAINSVHHSIESGLLNMNNSNIISGGNSEDWQKNSRTSIKSNLPRPVSSIPRPNSLSRIRPPSKTNVSSNSYRNSMAQHQWSPTSDNSF